MRPSTVEGLEDSVASWAEMKEEGGAIAEYADVMIEQFQVKLILLEYLLCQYTIDGLRLTLKHRSGDAWGDLIPDAYQQGRFRWQAIQRDGFSGHCTHETPELCIGDMVDDGYALLDMGPLDRLSATAEWQRAMEIVAVIQACYAGQMSFEDAMRKREDIYSRYAKDA
ncbi:hypothetical protein [Pseudomonas aeruginosa]|uniref:hypothetical protein n=1 Tax=Pseudomonas aeruginosa TaxID=287 RepID=UPI001E3F3578|nr:hypothetical protein [Pseudomonas aeruginosa]MCC9289610.1 hypothetical protein [Pseudomonas aeruginosa]UVN18858.1 Hypothetical protein [Pseudomonas aeruginosa]